MICKSEREGGGFGRESLTSIRILRESVNKTPPEGPSYVVEFQHHYKRLLMNSSLLRNFMLCFSTKHFDVRTAMDRGKIMSLL